MKPACFGETTGFALPGAENEYGGGLRAKPGAESRQRGRVGDRIEVHHHQIVGRSQGDARREGVFPAVARRQGSRSHQGVKRRSWICGNAGPSEKCRPWAPGRNGFSPAERRRPDQVERERRVGREGERPSAAAFGQAPPQSTRLLGTSVHNVDQGYVCSVVSQNNTANVQREVGVIAAPARSAAPRGGRDRPVRRKKCVMLASRHRACRQPRSAPTSLSRLFRSVVAISGFRLRKAQEFWSLGAAPARGSRVVWLERPARQPGFTVFDGSVFKKAQASRCLTVAVIFAIMASNGRIRLCHQSVPSVLLCRRIPPFRFHFRSRAPARNPLHAEFGLSGYPVKGEADPVPAGNSLGPVAHN